MKYGISSLNWQAPFRTEDAWLIGHVGSMGFESFEVTVWEPEPFDVDLLAEEFRRHNVEPTVSTLQTAERDLTDPDPAVRDRGVSHLKSCLDIAESLGARRIVGPIVAGHSSFRLRSPEDFQRDLEHCVAALGEVLPYAADRGVTLIFEPLNRYESSFCTRAKESARLVDAVGDPSFRMMLDTFHANIEDPSLEDAVRTAGDRLAYIQVIDSHRGMLGTGHLPWDELKGSLEGIAYDGPIVIEAIAHHVPTLAELGRIWHPVASSPDELAVEGLKFLRDLFGPAR